MTVARIRTIKPMFWTDAAIVSLPFEYRLLFIGLWNFADDEGFIVNDARQIRMWVFPADDVDVAKGVRGLAKCGLVDSLTLTESGRNVKVLRIKGWNDHQVISRATKSKWHDPYADYQAGRQTHGVLRESHGAPRGTPSGREGKGREGKGSITQVGGGTHLSSGDAISPPPPTPGELPEPWRCAKHQGIDVPCHSCKQAKADFKAREAAEAKAAKDARRQADLEARRQREAEAAATERATPEQVAAAKAKALGKEVA